MRWVQLMDKLTHASEEYRWMPVQKIELNQLSLLFRCNRRRSHFIILSFSASEWNMIEYTSADGRIQSNDRAQLFLWLFAFYFNRSAEFDDLRNSKEMERNCIRSATTGENGIYRNYSTTNGRTKNISNIFEWSNMNFHCVVESLYLFKAERKWK